MYERTKNVILGEKLSPDKLKHKEHRILKSSAFVAMRMGAILTILKYFGPLSAKQTISMTKKKLGDDISYAKTQNWIRSLSLLGYIKKERVTKVLSITQKGEDWLAHLQEISIKFVYVLFDRDLATIGLESEENVSEK